MQGNFFFEKHNMWVSMAIDEDRIVVTVGGVEVHQLTNKENGEVSLAAFSKGSGGRHFLQQEDKYFSQKIS